MDDIKVTHTTQFSKDDPYERLMGQLVREEELDGIIIISYKTLAGRMIFNSRSHGGDAPGSDGLADMLSQIATTAAIKCTKSLITAIRRDSKEGGHGN